ncbi:MAG: transposase [Polyangiaceae bacterium]|nr:transposase [Polyangiaceae bacterium]
MSYARKIVPGKTYLLTRRTMRRYFLLRPDDEMKELIEYSLAVSARIYGMDVHAFCAMSTHIHVVLTDTRGVLSYFLAYFNRLVAMGTKVLRRWEGSIWDSEQPSVVELLTRKALVEKIAYVLANPVAAGAVLDPEEWPGAKTRVCDIGQMVLKTSRPRVYFDPSKWRDVLNLPITLPPTIAEADAGAFRDDVAEALAREVEEARKTIAPENVLGANRAATISPETRSKTPEPTRKLNPTFAAGRGCGAIAAAAARAVTAFRAAYREALEQWRMGDRDVAFPAGTWWMRVFHSVNIGGSS